MQCHFKETFGIVNSLQIEGDIMALKDEVCYFCTSSDQ